MRGITTRLRQARKNRLDSWMSSSTADKGNTKLPNRAGAASGTGTTSKPLLGTMPTGTASGYHQRQFAVPEKKRSTDCPHSYNTGRSAGQRAGYGTKFVKKGDKLAARWEAAGFGPATKRPSTAPVSR